MDLLSINFWGIVFFVLIFFYLTPDRFRWAVLLAASYYFYFATHYKYFIFILLTTLSTYYVAQKIDQINKKKSNLSKQDDKLLIEQLGNQSKKYLIFVLLLNFGILVFLKYHNLSSNMLLRIFPQSGSLQSLRLMKIALPLGISFYTFQTAGYIVDVYRGKHGASNHLGKYALFVSYFPQIIQGPISRFSDLFNQFEKKHIFHFEGFVKATQLVIWGFFKKLVIADRAAVVVNEVFGNYENYSGIVIFWGALFYAIQIYGDFSGGIDIITGISEMFGIKLAKNFERPYFSKSVSEFWKRWHITLGTWMRDYIFYPLALSRRFGLLGRKLRKKFGNHIGKQMPAALASTIVFILVGAWHGSSLKFVAYGIYNGIFVLSAPLLEPIYAKSRTLFGVKDKNSGSFLGFQVIRTMTIITIGRIFSRAASFKDSLAIFKRLFYEWNPWVLFDQTLYKLGLDKPEMTVLFFSLLLLFIISYTQEKGIKTRTWLHKQPLFLRWTLLISLVLFIVIFGHYGPEYTEQDFIYGGF